MTRYLSFNSAHGADILKGDEVLYFGFSFDKTVNKALCKERDDDLQSPPYFPQSPIPRQTQLQGTMLGAIKGPLGEPTIWGSIKRSFHDR